MNINTVSLHGIQVCSNKGLYPEEKLLENRFEADIDIQYLAERPELVVDYTLINQIVQKAFTKDFSILERLAEDLYTELKEVFPFSRSVKVTIRKYNPPMPGRIKYAQVTLERE